MLKVRPQYQVCRDSASECDVPEFCDGISGQVCFITVDLIGLYSIISGTSSRYLIKTHTAQCVF